MTTPPQRREALTQLRGHGLSGPAACRWSGLSRHVLQYTPALVERDTALLLQMRAVTKTYPRFGYRRVAVLTHTSFKRAWRLPLALRLPAGQTTGWKRHGFQLQPARARRHRLPDRDPRPHSAERPNQVWTYDILHDQLADRRRFKTLSVLDEFTRECLVIRVGRTLRAPDVIVALTMAMQAHGKSEFIRSDNGSEFTATQVRQWLQGQVVGPSFIQPGRQPGRPWQNGYVESFHGKFRDECLNREWFRSSWEAEVVIEQWRQHYHTQRPHSAVGYKTPAQVAAEYPCSTREALISTGLK